MKVFIANFGRENYLWPECLARSTVATFEDEDMRPLWLAGDRDGYIARCIATKKTAAGIKPTRPVVSGWFNLAERKSSHRQKVTSGFTARKKSCGAQYLNLGSLTSLLEPAFKPTGNNERVYVLHKPAQRWSNKNKQGSHLEWRAVHPKAQAEAN